MIHIEKFTFGAFAENTYILYDENKNCIVVDPGCMDEGERLELTNFISDNGLKVEKVVNTHCHIDHIFGNKFVKEHFGVKLYIPKDEAQVLAWGKLSADKWGIPGFEETEPDEFIPNEGKLTLGNEVLEILFVPGHSPGHLAFYNKEGAFVIGGDVLFKQSIGRTDLPGGDMATLTDSIRKVMYQLPEDTVVHCGHGPSTTIGEEKRMNPFVRAV
ncbi:MBL fold metallo-hydrolase [Limibacter armeniacum]|uniref:MBL fold metallo-hydrolase n=1 Tax=Limibacter armeniacum TaxID=466084 RepID=UPI002FE5FAFA